MLNMEKLFPPDSMTIMAVDDTQAMSLFCNALWQASDTTFQWPSTEKWP